MLFLCPSRELVFQGHERLIEHGLPAGIMMGDVKPKEGETVHVATVQTASRRDLGKYDLVVIDEAHKAVSDKCYEILDRYKGSKILGVTATPIRMDGRPLSKAFDEMIIVSTVVDLIQEGYLVPFHVFAPATPPDLSNVGIDYGTRDYKVKDLDHVYSDKKLAGNIVETWQEKAHGRPTFCYCVSLAHAKSLTDRFVKAGVKAAMIEGSTGKGARQELFDRLVSRALTILVTVAVLIEGVDLPEVSCLIVARPTLSKGLWIQILGRGARPAKNKRDCLVLDHADNTRKHGFLEDPREWSLAKGDPHQGTAAQAHVEHSKRCPRCGRMIPIQAMECPGCGLVWIPREMTGRLIEIRTRIL
jgi:superfamily II DNA or RNA helicase